MRFRTACPADAPKLLEIYREYIDTTITFEYALPSVEEFEGRIRSISEFFPYLVLEDDAGTIVGYAYAHRHMERAAYQWNAELSIYLSRKLAGKGWGREVLQSPSRTPRASGHEGRVRVRHVAQSAVGKAPYEPGV